MGKTSRGMLLAALLLIMSCPEFGYAVQKGASVSLKARWNGTSYLLEAAEMMAEEHPVLYWRFVDSVVTDVTLPQLEPTACWNQLLSKAWTLVTASVAKLVPLVLGSRQYTAKVEMYRQLASQLHPGAQACCFVSVDGVLGYTVDEVQALIHSRKAALSAADASSAETSQAEELYAFDHIYNSAKQAPGSITAVLYGAPGTACFQQLHTALQALATAVEAVPLVYAVRPVLQPSCEANPCLLLGTQEPLVLPGYGVEAALKNMEYSALDDKKAAAEGGAGAKLGDDEALGEVKGFNFDVLAARKPHLRQELLTFRDQLQAADEEETLKVWDLKDVGLQATQRVLSASDPLALLTEISQSFPSLVSSLTRQAVNASLRGAINHNQQYMSAGGNYMLINGLAFDIDTLDYFGLLERLRIEARLADSLSLAGLPASQVQSILEARAEEGASGSLADARLDLGNTQHVVWLNDMEKDRQYQRLSSSLTDLMNTFPGRLRPIARNVFNLVLLVDPVSSEGLHLAAIIHKMWSDGYPIRFGLAMTVPAVVDRIQEQKLYPFRTHSVPEWHDMTFSERFGRAFLTLKSVFGQSAAFKLWQQLSELEGDEFTESELQPLFEAVWAEAAEKPLGARARIASRKKPADAWTMVTTGSGMASEVGMQLQELTNWLLSKGIASFSAPAGWMNGHLLAFAESPEQTILMKVMHDMQKVQEWVYYGKLDDEDEFLPTIMKLGGAISRWNPQIVSDTTPVMMSMVPLLQHPLYRTLQPLYRDGGKARLHPATHYVITDVRHAEGRALAAQAARYLAEVGSSRDARVVLLLNPLLPDEAATALELVLQMAWGQAVEAGRHKVAAFLQKVLSDVALSERLAGPLLSTSVTEAEVVRTYADAAGLNGEGMLSALVSVISVAVTGGVANPLIPAFKFRRDHAQLVREALQLTAGSCAVISNGRLFQVVKPNPLDPATPVSLLQLEAEDFQLLQLLVARYQSGEAVAKLLQTAYEEGQMEDLDQGFAPAALASLDDMVVGATSALAAPKYPESRLPPGASKQLMQVLGILRSGNVEVGQAPEEGSAPSNLRITAILNPLTRPAQRISQVLLLLRSTLRPQMTLHLNPQRDLTEMPLKSYYRYALPGFSASSSGSGGWALPTSPTATFERLPTRRIMTLNMDVPEPWLVEPSRAPYDLDNLRLEDVPERMAYAEFELEALMLTGSCQAADGRSDGTGTRGLQLHLGTPSHPHTVDTLVMANLAYFQLKAAPGRWLLSLAPGRSKQLYSMVSSTGTSEVGGTAVAVPGGDGGADDGSSTQVIISSLTGKHMVLRVQKRPGYEHEDVLESSADESAMQLHDAEDEDEDDYEESPSSSKAKGKGLWGNVKSILGGTGSNKKGDSSALEVAPLSEVINVFTVASGHMYERLQKIMILSVIQNTKHRVKFWIIKNYMSPHHKSVIPAMAAQFGFDYEFVTYKWPHWLHKQTDKQRIIWAYKILFLDVLFPLDVPRVIFLDSDQVIRTDIAQLYFMDIQGAPYAYTPFCDNNKEMDEFRFWKGGFWKEHLRGKPYHISALYLIDLKKFRQMAAGDQLRVVYDQLSKDPNSLANLDQDLPNYVQHQIPIFSLPQAWLWCESWCGNTTKDQAKTIDLCNNPKTKEPKLSAARRIVAEWPALDEAQAAFTAQVDAQLQSAEEGGASVVSNIEATAEEAAELTELASSQAAASESIATSQMAAAGHNRDEL